MAVIAARVVAPKSVVSPRIDFAVDDATELASEPVALRGGTRTERGAASQHPACEKLVPMRSCSGRTAILFGGTDRALLASHASGLIWLLTREGSLSQILGTRSLRHSRARRQHRDLMRRCRHSAQRE